MQTNGETACKNFDLKTVIGGYLVLYLLFRILQMKREQDFDKPSDRTRNPQGAYPKAYIPRQSLRVSHKRTTRLSFPSKNIPPPARISTIEKANSDNIIYMGEEEAGIPLIYSMDKYIYPVWYRSFTGYSGKQADRGNDSSTEKYLGNVLGQLEKDGCQYFMIIKTADCYIENEEKPIQII